MREPERSIPCNAHGDFLHALHDQPKPKDEAGAPIQPMITLPVACWWDIARIGQAITADGLERRDGIRHAYGLALLAVCHATAPTSFARQAIDDIFGDPIGDEADELGVDEGIYRCFVDNSHLGLREEALSNRASGRKRKRIYPKATVWLWEEC